LFFFVAGAGGLQIRRIDQSDGHPLARVFGEQGFQEPLVDLAQPAHADAFPKLVEHPDIRDGVAVGEVGKAAPSSLLGQQPHQLVERMYGGQNAQQMDAV
jgi:hypothetical protein